MEKLLNINDQIIYLQGQIDAFEQFNAIIDTLTIIYIDNPHLNKVKKSIKIGLETRIDSMKCLKIEQQNKESNIDHFDYN